MFHHPYAPPKLSFLRRHHIFCGLLLHHCRSNFAKQASLPRYLRMSMHTDHFSPKQWEIPLDHCCRHFHWGRQLVLLERLRIRRGEIRCRPGRNEDIGSRSRYGLELPFPGVCHLSIKGLTTHLAAGPGTTLPLPPHRGLAPPAYRRPAAHTSMCQHID